METEYKYGNHDWCDGVKYTCQKESKEPIIEEGTKIATYKGIHAAGKTNIDVEAFCVGSTQIEYFPRGLSSIFPRLTTVMINNCGIKEISRKDLKGLGNLEAWI